MGVEIFHSLKKILNKKKLSTAVGDEGGFAPKLKGTEDAIETIYPQLKWQATSQERKLCLL